MACLLSHLFKRRAARSIRVPRLARENEATEDQTASMLPEEFLKIELAQIERNRRALNLSMPATATQIPALAISGGGIRSAVFSLGVLQALADRSALDHFAYISTVSGGSYLGAFHGSLFVPDALRAGDQDTHADVFAAQARTVSGRLRPKAAPPAPNCVTPVSYLRDNCNYLVPNGIDDALQSVAFSMRNWFALQYVLGVTLLTILLWLNLIETVGAYRCQRIFTYVDMCHSLPLVLSLGVAVLVLSPLSRAYWLTQNLAQETRTVYKLLPFVSLVILTMVAFAAFLSNEWWLSVGWPTPQSTDSHTFHLITFGSVYVIATEVFAVLAFALAWGYAGRTATAGKSWFPTSTLGAAKRSDSRAFVDRLRNALTNAYTTPLRIRNLSFFSGPIQVMLWGIAVWVIDQLGKAGYQYCLVLSERLFNGASGAVPSLTVLAGSGAGIWGVSKFLLSKDSAISSLLISTPRIVLATVTAGLAALLTLTFWSIAAQAVIATLDAYVTVGAFARFMPDIWPFNQMPRVAMHLIVCIVLLVLAIIDGLCIQFLNLSTYQRLYSTRLTRTFLGATNCNRLDNADQRDVTSLVPGDSVAMTEYYHPRSCAPVHLINSTVNKTVDWNSSLVQRGARGLSLSVGPAGLSIGAKMGVLKCDWQYANDISTPATHIRSGTPTFNIWLESLTVGDWIAISGAAVSTGLGQDTRSGYSLLLGIANIRLGYWWDTYSAPFRRGALNFERARVPLPPNQDPHRFVSEKLFGTQFCLLSELIGRFDGPRGRRWYLTDGGHFENTAAYELLRRHLEFIVVIDNGCDDKYGFGDIANLMRRVRVDFGIEMEENSACSSAACGVRLKEKLIASSFDEFKRRPECLAVRLVTRFPTKRSGQLLIIKPRLTDCAPHDVRQFVATQKTFPHESTADQFFDDVQWESHRALGYSQADALFA